jgi:hypothetical protein
MNPSAQHRFRNFLPRRLTFSEGTGMDNLIQDEAEMEELKYEHSSGSTESSETNGETSMSIKDPDTTLSMIVLLLACLALAALAHVVV